MTSKELLDLLRQKIAASPDATTAIRWAQALGVVAQAAAIEEGLKGAK